MFSAVTAFMTDGNVLPIKNSAVNCHEEYFEDVDKFAKDICIIHLETAVERTPIILDYGTDTKTLRAITLDSSRPFHSQAFPIFLYQFKVSVVPHYDPDRPDLEETTNCVQFTDGGGIAGGDSGK